MLQFLSYLLPTTLRMGTPIALASLGGVVSQKSGVNNIGIEGIMVMGAFLGVVGSYITGNPWVGIIFAMVAGGLIALIHSFLTVTVGARQAISSMSLVLLADGLCGVLVQKIFGNSGTSSIVKNLPSSMIFAEIPLVGKFLTSLSPFVYLGIIMLAVFTYIFKYTRFGFHVTSVGENPRMAETAGINVHRIRYIAVIISGVLAGLGGAMLSIAQMNLFQKGMVAGRGYLALGAITVGRWSCLGCYGVSMLLGLFEALQLYIQTLPNCPIPADFVQIIPYVGIVIVLAFTSKKNKYFGVTAAGKPYTKYVSSVED